MTFRYPEGFISLRDAHESHASTFSPDSAVTTAHRRAAALRLRQAILNKKLPLCAMLSPERPQRLTHDALFEQAGYTSDTVLTFNHIVRCRGRDFGLSWQELKKFSRDPLCLEEKAFRQWQRKELRTRARRTRSDGAPPGRPATKRDQALKAFEQLHARGQLRPGMRDIEVVGLVQTALHPLEISPDTAVRARKLFAEKKVRR